MFLQASLTKHKSYKIINITKPFSHLSDISRKGPLPGTHTQLVIYDLYQGGPTFFFPRAKNSFPVGPKSQETPAGTIF
jgi:hypothetical protein